MELLWTKFYALGTEIIISAFLDSKQKSKLKKAEKEIRDFEKRFSRFIKNNELYKLNNFSGETFSASKIMVDLLKESKKMYIKTKGVFDPTIIKNLEKVGYDRTFTQINQEDEIGEVVDLKSLEQDFSKRSKFSDLKIVDNKVILPKGMRVDFGGIGKGYIVDYLNKTVFKDVKSYWISAGGDLFLKGNSQDQVGWKIGVQNPNSPQEEIFSVDTKGKEIGIATSGIFLRKGIKGEFEWHHLIDPRTGLPVKNDIIAVTAISSTAENADVFGKTVLILGEKEGVEFIENQKDSACVIFFKNREMVMSKNMVKYF